MVGITTALYDVGAFFGTIAAAFTAEGLGRKRTLLLRAAIVIIGTVLMGSLVEKVQFMVARIVAGAGIGYVTSVAPVYQSEISAAAHREWQVCCQLTTMLFGLILAYWINYGVCFINSAFQWHFPLLFQCVFAVYFLAHTIWLPDTPRWLMRHDGSPERGVIVLAKLRALGEGYERIQREKEDIMEAIAIESKEEGIWGVCLGIMGLRRIKGLIWRWGFSSCSR
jgi:MFS family permease